MSKIRTLSNNKNVRYLHLDLAKLSSVHNFVSDFQKRKYMESLNFFSEFVLEIILYHGKINKVFFFFLYCMIQIESLFFTT